MEHCTNGKILRLDKMVFWSKISLPTDFTKLVTEENVEFTRKCRIHSCDTDSFTLDRADEFYKPVKFQGNPL